MLIPIGCFGVAAAGVIPDDRAYVHASVVKSGDYSPMIINAVDPGLCPSPRVQISYNPDISLDTTRSSWLLPEPTQDIPPVSHESTNFLSGTLQPFDPLPGSLPVLSPENPLISPINPNHQGVITLPDPTDVLSGWLRTDLSSQKGAYNQTIGVWFKADISAVEAREIISTLNPEFRSEVVDSCDLYMVVPRSDYERVIGLLRNESGVSVYDPDQPGTRMKMTEDQAIILFTLLGDKELTKYQLQNAGFIIQKPLVMIVNIGQHDQDYYYTTMDRLYQDEHILRVTASSNAC